MEQETFNILLFKTNIQEESDIERVKPALNAHHRIEQWNVDLHDVDCVLRVVSELITPAEIIQVINANGFSCTELE